MHTTLLTEIHFNDRYLGKCLRKASDWLIENEEKYSFYDFHATYDSEEIEWYASIYIMGNHNELDGT